VLATAPDQYQSAVEASGRLARLDLQYSFDRFNLVFERHRRSQPHIQLMLERAQKIVEKTGVALNVTDKPVENSLNICLIDINETDPESPLPYPPASSRSEELRIYVPSLSEQAYRDPYSGISVIRRVSTVPGGLWTGINNVGNAMLAALQMANAGGTHSPFLTNGKKGYIHA
jgi:hypothetical protein